MKTFLNVLYRRILYKIPLKLLLVLLAIFGLLFACTKADLVIDREYITKSAGGYDIHPNNGDEILCVKYLENCGNMQGNFGVYYNMPGGSNYHIDQVGTGDFALFYCILTNTVNYLSTWSDNACSIEITHIKSIDYTSQQCQSEYSLIPISEVDSSYCQSNNLCPSGGSPSDCPNVGVSNLFINDIFHPGAFNIIMNIPEEISRDYAYTNSGNNFNLDIEGYNVDYEKMQSVIDNQSYIPTEEDFQNIIAILTPYTKIIVFFVFLFIVWAWIKKPFKSKKL